MTCRHMFVTLDCGKTVATYKTQFSPRHLEFDEKLEGKLSASNYVYASYLCLSDKANWKVFIHMSSHSGRFLVHDREDEKMELFVTKNFGETFSHAGDYIKSFYFDHREVP